jgi:hypothetical protein
MQTEFDVSTIPADDLREEYNSLYGKAGPRLAGMKRWDDSWIPENSLGWLDWYTQYHNGKRTDDDERQIKRWKSFKARHTAQFVKNPTPRRAAMFRLWAIDPLKLIQDETQRKELEQSMEAYKAKAWEDYENSK